MKIYYSHSVCDYNTDYEARHMDAIMEHYWSPFPDENVEIINPKDVKIDPEDLPGLKGNFPNFISNMRKYYYPKIQECDLFIASPSSETGNLTQGVKLEMEYAKSIGKPTRLCILEEE